MNTFNDLITDGSIVAYQRQDGSFSLWKAVKNNKVKDGYFQCTSLVEGSSQGAFPVKNLSKVYPIVGCFPSVEYTLVNNHSSELYVLVTFKRFVFKQGGSVEGEVINRKKGITMITLKDFLNEFIPENSVVCEI